MGATVNENLNKKLEMNEIKSFSSQQTFLLKTKKRKSVPLTCKTAAELLITGNLKKKVCRFCLKSASPLTELDQFMQIAGKEGLYKVTIRDMVGSFHPVTITSQPHIPNRICESCLNQTISCYLFAQQCNQAERAMVNFLEDIDDKINKLDSLETPRKKRGRQKLNPNYNSIHVEHNNVIDYAEPRISLVNRGSALFIPEQVMTVHPLECLKCWEVLPNIQSLLNHEKSHPTTMCFNCRFCGQSFNKRLKIKTHLKKKHVKDENIEVGKTDFHCKDCGYRSESYGEHLQHVEKHKFQVVFEHIIERKMEKLCSVCLEKRSRLVDMDRMVSVHGGYPMLTGDKSILSIVNATIPDIPSPHSVTGKKICDKCLDSAINTYIFLNHTHYVRNRLETCINQTLEGLSKLDEDDTDKSLFVEINKETILPSQDDRYLDNAITMAENDVLDESDIDVDVLEDEFREESENDEDDKDDVTFDKVEGKIKDEPLNKNLAANNLFNSIHDNCEDFNLAKRAKKTYTKKNLMNGFPQKKVTFGDVTCNEFLTFKKKTKKVEKYSCQICKKTFLTEFHFVRHLLRHVNRQVKCDPCGKSYSSKFEFREHKKMVHILKRGDYSTCRICRRSFTDAKHLEKHEKFHVKPNCQLCDKTFSNHEKLDRHLQRHLPMLTLKKEGKNCSFCEKLCSDDNQLSLHVNKSHLQIKPYHCDMCEAQFYTEKNLRYHKKIHNLKSREKCEFCMKILKCRRSLVIHVRKHIGVKPWHCYVCKLEFYSENKLLWHMNRQHGGKYVCNCCKSVFSSQNDLKYHVDTVHVTRSEPNFYISLIDS